MASTQGKSPRRAVEVSLLGQRMSLRAEGDTRQVDRVVAFVRRKIDELSAQGPIASPKLAVLTAINIADDYLRLLEETRELKRAIAARSRSLLEELDP